MKPNTNPFRGLILVLFVVALVFCGTSIYRTASAHQQTDRVYSDIRTLFEQEKVDRFTVDDNNNLTITLKEPVDGSRIVVYSIYNFQLFYDDFNDLVVKQYESGILSSYDYPDSPSPAWMSTILTWVVVLAVMAILWYFLFLRRTQGGGGGPSASQFGKAKARTLAETGRTVTFDDVAGADEEKEELAEIVDFLRQPAQYTQLGARIPKGVLLVGPPGTGKTLLARAVAGEAGCQYLSISGSDFVELYVGVGASRVRDLFEQAKKSSPAIVFIDEIDAVGRQRGAGLGGGHDEREQTLNQLLVEMDGFASNEGVIVLAATNRADILDPALLRPGRFDRQIYVGLPDIKGREEILRVHARNKPLAEDVDLRTIAQATVGFTGADLENLLNEAALLSAREKRPFIRMDVIHEAMLKVIAGPEKKSRVVPPHAKKLTAYHEAGHAVVIHELKTQDPVHQITIIPRGPAGGLTISRRGPDVPVPQGIAGAHLHLPGRPGGRGIGAGRHLHRRFQRLADGDLHRPQHGDEIRHERPLGGHLLRQRPGGLHRPQHVPGPRLLRGDRRADRRGDQGPAGHSLRPLPSDPLREHGRPGAHSPVSAGV